MMYLRYIVKRTQIYLREDHDRLLGERARAAGRTKSELIREALDDYLGDAEANRLARFRKALDDAAGIAPYLPPGAEYVEELRKAGLARQRWLDERWGRD